MRGRNDAESSRWKQGQERLSSRSRPSESGSSSSIIASPSKKRRLDHPISTPPRAREARCVHLAEVEGLELGYEDQELRTRVTAVLKKNGLQPVDIQSWLTAWWRKARSGRDQGQQFTFVEKPPGRFEIQAWMDFERDQESFAEEWRMPSDEDPVYDNFLPQPIPEDGCGILKALLHETGLLAGRDSPQVPPQVPENDRLLQFVPVKLIDRPAAVENVRPALASTDNALVELLIPLHLPQQSPACQGQSTPFWLQFEHHVAASSLTARKGSSDAQTIVWTPEALLTVAGELARLSSSSPPQGSSSDLSGSPPQMVVQFHESDQGDVIRIVLPWSQIRHVRWLLAQIRTGSDYGTSPRVILPLTQASNAHPSKTSNMANAEVTDEYEGTTASEASLSEVQAAPPSQGVFLPVRDPVSGDWLALC
ncbi:unnamed protein product [Tilletia controversa]|uniref:Uncharacterized protein n=3 Tax=Tilletia TaxID=13289 RepID=A0A8X7MUU2_9BASI|nr:hypothetical protein CF336_g3179 [Tilletia laevis]KAE8200582.1 hypothetical protein CF328_g2922 [Tilletia controversa]KAE8262253.1 hypothetical protein A4X03_0g2599 [Tilletia caries]KAE8205423.1 hypothetical protein CF335_g2302 [Tilletia laevis]KAE8249929.1 hypothetical protein A4X06_0g3008 [Tilletia controversa]